MLISIKHHNSRLPVKNNKRYPVEYEAMVLPVGPCLVYIVHSFKDTHNAHETLKSPTDEPQKTLCVKCFDRLSSTPCELHV